MCILIFIIKRKSKYLRMGCSPLQKVNSVQFTFEKTKQSFERMQNPFKGIPEEQSYHFNENEQWMFEKETNRYYKGKQAHKTGHGKIIIYHPENGSFFIGVFIDRHLLNDFGKKITPEGEVYTGEFSQQGEMEGRGILQIPQIGIYEGQFKESKYHGEGKLITKDEMFEGQFQNGQKKKGQKTTDRGTYTGDFVNGLEESITGQYKWIQGGKYLGQFQGGKMHGKGKLYNSDGQYVGLRKMQMGEIAG